MRNVDPENQGDENSNDLTMEDEMADKLDILMSNVFVYIERICYHDGRCECTLLISSKHELL